MNTFFLSHWLILSFSLLLKEVGDGTGPAAEEGQHTGEGEVLLETQTHQLLSWLAVVNID